MRRDGTRACAKSHVVRDHTILPTPRGQPWVRCTGFTASRASALHFAKNLRELCISTLLLRTGLVRVAIRVGRPDELKSRSGARRMIAWSCALAVPTPTWFSQENRVPFSEHIAHACGRDLLPW